MQIIDLNFLDHTDTIASFLIDSNDGLILVESGPYSTYNHLTEVLTTLGAKPADVRHVLLTHIHLDHAGAAWAFAKQGAQVYVHPRGYKHMANPERLWASAKRIYQDEMEYLWGDMQAIDTNLLHAMEDAKDLKIGGQTFTPWYTPGHAVHHIAWQHGDGIFTGDVGGVKIGNNLVAPPCPPPDINLEDWKSSIDILLKLNPKSIFLTHFGEVTEVESHLMELEKRLDKWANWIKPYFDKGIPAKELVPQFQAFSIEEMKAEKVSQPDIERYLKANPPWMSVWGLMRYFEVKRNSEK